MIRLTLPWGTRVEHERRNRIRIAVYAYAYEFRDESLVSDSEYDDLARRINPSLFTGNPTLDAFFMLHYTPDSGMWIHKHPDLAGVERILTTYYCHQG